MEWIFVNFYVRKSDATKLSNKLLEEEHDIKVVRVKKGQKTKRKILLGAEYIEIEKKDGYKVYRSMKTKN